MQCIQCDGGSFSLDISMSSSSLYVYDARPYHWSFLEGHRDCWNTYLSCIYHVRGDIPPQTTFPFVFCSLSPRSEPFITIHSSTDYSCFWPRPKALILTIALQNSSFFLSSEEKTGVLNF